MAMKQHPQHAQGKAEAVQPQGRQQRPPDQQPQRQRPAAHAALDAYHILRMQCSSGLRCVSCYSSTSASSCCFKSRCHVGCHDSYMPHPTAQEWIP